MRAHKRSWKVFAPALAIAAVLLPAAIGYSHPDALGQALRLAQQRLRPEAVATRSRE